MVNGQQVYNCINTTQAGDPKCQLRCDDAEQAAAAALTEALDVALSNVRLSLMGQWHLNQKLSALSVDDTLNDGGLPPGALYALSGSIQYEEELGLKQTLIAGAGQSTAIGEQGVGTKLTEIYDVGRDVTSATMWDRRPTIRKPCAAPVDCAIMSDGANPPTETECFIVCDTGTSLCPNNGDGAPAREGLSVGVSGQCCDGTCYANAANKECQACIDWNIGVSSSDNPYGSTDTQCGG